MDDAGRRRAAAARLGGRRARGPGRDRLGGDERGRAERGRDRRDRPRRAERDRSGRRPSSSSAAGTSPPARPAPRRPPSRRAQRQRAKRTKSGVVRGLWAAGKGRFRTRGRFGTASVRGTRWATVDRCSTTTVKVFDGVVDVTDLITGRTTAVEAGEKHVVRARRRVAASARADERDEADRAVDLRPAQPAVAVAADEHEALADRRDEAPARRELIESAGGIRSRRRRGDVDRVVRRLLGEAERAVADEELDDRRRPRRAPRARAPTAPRRARSTTPARRAARAPPRGSPSRCRRRAPGRRGGRRAARTCARRRAAGRSSARCRSAAPRRPTPARGAPGARTRRAARRRSRRGPGRRRRDRAATAAGPP